MPDHIEEHVMEPFQPFPKIPRLNREVVITEMIDGTNAQVRISDEPLYFDPALDLIARVDGQDRYVRAGSRNRWLTLGGEGGDNFGFASWVYEHLGELASGLGLGTHYGEWWGRGIQRGYGLDHKRFSLFNVGRWVDRRTVTDGTLALAPACCHVVPVLYRGPMDQAPIRSWVASLKIHGSLAAPGFPNPEGLVVYHTAANQLFKVTLEGDEKPKGLA